MVSACLRLRDSASGCGNAVACTQRICPVQPNAIQLKRKVFPRCTARVAQRSHTHTEIREAAISTSFTPKSQPVSPLPAQLSPSERATTPDGRFSACALAFAKKIEISYEILTSFPDLPVHSHAEGLGTRLNIFCTLSRFFGER